MRTVQMCTVGHIDHGKSTLTAAILKIFNQQMSKITSIDEGNLDKASAGRGITIAATTVKAEVDYIDENGEKQIVEVHISDLPGHADFMKNMIRGTYGIDVALIMVDLIKGKELQTSAHILVLAALAKAALSEGNDFKILVVITKLDILNKPDDDIPLAIDLVETQIIEEFEKIFTGEISKFIPSKENGDYIVMSPKMVLEPFPHPFLSFDSESAKLKTLMRKVASYMPKRRTEGHFSLHIESVHSIAGRGTVVTGKVKSGVLPVGSVVQVVGEKGIKTFTVTAVESFHRQMDAARAGDNVGLLLRGVKKEDVERGDFITTKKVEEIQQNLCKKIEVTLYTYKNEDGGRKYAFEEGYMPSFSIATQMFTGKIFLPEGVKEVNPGETLEGVNVEFDHNIYIEIGMSFVIREGHQTVGNAIVTKLINETGSSS